MRHLPNLICVLRVVVTFLGLFMLAHLHAQDGGWSTPWVAVLTCAALTDRLDGFLAKRYGWATPLGAVLDQISDKLVTLALFSYLALLGAFPPWGLGLIVLRELFVTCLRISANLERIKIPTSEAGRFKTFTQQVAVLLIFMHWGWPKPVLLDQTLAQSLLWGGWLVFWLVMLGLGRRGFQAFARNYTLTRADPQTGEASRSRVDLVVVYLTIAAMAIPLTVGGPTVVLVITLGTGWTYFTAYLWARGRAARADRAGPRNVVLSFLAASAVSAGLAVDLARRPTQAAMWTWVAALSVAWIVLLTISYRTGQRASAPAEDPVATG